MEDKIKKEMMNELQDAELMKVSGGDGQNIGSPVIVFCGPDSPSGPSGSPAIVRWDVRNVDTLFFYVDGVEAWHQDSKKDHNCKGEFDVRQYVTEPGLHEFRMLARNVVDDAETYFAYMTL